MPGRKSFPVLYFSHAALIIYVFDLENEFYFFQLNEAPFGLAFIDEVHLIMNENKDIVLRRKGFCYYESTIRQ